MSKILLVEDDPNTRLGLYELLSEEGYEVATAENATAALEKICPGTDLLLSDLCLPDLSGLALHERLQRLYPTLPTIIMTAYSTPEQRQRARKLGVVSWITKPLDIERLLSKLRQVLQAPAPVKNKHDEIKPEEVGPPVFAKSLSS
ncbi:MAG: response regulator [bacterium]